MPQLRKLLFKFDFYKIITLIFKKLKSFKYGGGVANSKQILT